MYAGSEPCLVCLMACYWARIPRLNFGATGHDVLRKWADMLPSPVEPRF
ncbi:hypothetical protein GCM10010169_53190 [Micromonospora fulviviridis]|nr:hypothetical protein GCM10010169_53190 [Micromonospora fulviviridis]